MPGSLSELLLGSVLVALLFFYLALIYCPLERRFPARHGQRFLRPEWSTDLCFFLGEYLVFNGLALEFLWTLRGGLDGLVPAGVRSAVASQAWWLQALEVVVLGDLFIYWGHRMEHRIDLLWRFHSVHHSVVHLDWLAANREHPLDTVYSVTLVNLPALIMGFPVETLAMYWTFRGLWAVFIHSNVRLDLGPLRMLVGSPELHHWHHDLDRDAGNYANLSPLMDILFGTYHCPDREPARFGMREPIPRTYLGLLAAPLLPRHRDADGRGVTSVEIPDGLALSLEPGHRG
jgi:sterol desaturase/sphingolipid hydroxylase (fatty acid hydroxylase superfamily)